VRLYTIAHVFNIFYISPQSFVWPNFNKIDGLLKEGILFVQEEKILEEYYVVESKTWDISLWLDNFD